MTDHTIEDILQQMKTYMTDSNSFGLIQKAYDIAKEKHEGQFRKSGEPYVQHPLEVAYLLATLSTGPHTIAAALVHDVVEDTGTSIELIRNELGNDVANIVDGVTKISKLKYMTAQKALASDHQKILLAMAKDIRVILVKLIDRLHNMRTLEFHIKEKQMRIAKETVELYAPLAHRLGMYRIKAELEDLSLKYIAPEDYEMIAKVVSDKQHQRSQDIDNVINQIKKLLDKNGVKDFEIKGRIKNIYSIYKKIVSKTKTMDEIYDLLAIRVVVGSVEDCYRVLGLVHGEWTPLPLRFKDYIAVPKENLYQSLHTTIVANGGRIFEIQIRTHEMDMVAENGVAAHWMYKEGPNYSPEREQLEITNRLKWYKDLVNYVEMSGSGDPVDNLIEDIFSANVYVFTPKGAVIDLPSGSMPLDFAFRIHTEVGFKTIGAIVNGRIVPLSYKLKTGDVVEIRTSKSCPGPTKEWLKHARTTNARHKIKGFINKKQRDDLVARGQEDLEKFCKSKNFDIRTVDDKLINEVFGKNNIKTLEELYYELGKNIFTAQSAFNRITGVNDAKLDDELALKIYSEENAKDRRRPTNSYGIIVEGLEKVHLKLGNCCQPIRGDVIYGYISRGSGIIVHREGCPNIEKSEMERYIPIYWLRDFPQVQYGTMLKIFALDRRNLVADLINIINGAHASLNSITSTKNKDGGCITKIKLLVTDLDHLNHVVIALGKISEIYKIERVFK